MSGVPNPRELLQRHGLSPKKSWGQNFLIAADVHLAIAEAADAGGGRPIVEIGAGLGTLTGHLLAAGATVVAIERDRDLCMVLRAELSAALEDESLRLVEADAVKADYASLVPDARPTIVGNLPYQLTGPLLFRLLEFHEKTGPWVVMVQREVADRLAAEPGGRTYGGITAALGRVRSVDRVRRVPPGCFLPPPRVDSAVVRLDPLPEPQGPPVDPRGYLALVRTAFQRRRKTLLNALEPIASDKDEVRRWCAAADVDPGLRPERLWPADFAALQAAREGERDA